MPKNVKDYYRKVTSNDIGRIARDLLGDRIKNRSPSRLEINCPHHESQTQRSLHVYTDKQSWYCYGCGTGGDVLQFVEFVQSGNVTRGIHGEMTASHRNARDYLAAKAGLPPLSGEGVDPQKMAEIEATRAETEAVQHVLTELAKIYCARLKANAEVLEWVKKEYGFTDETIDRLQIGIADNRTVLNKETNKRISIAETLLRFSNVPDEPTLIMSSAFLSVKNRGTVPYFDRRIVFPYWSRGRVVFMIGRKTRWTPDLPWEKPKYKKLMVYSEERPYIAQCVTNSYIYNEDCLSSHPDQVLITEGVTDCIAAMQSGIPCISPVTITFRKSDIKRLVKLTKRVKRVVICNDSELSGAGETGALDTAKALFKANIQSFIATIPLPSGKDKIDVNELVKTQGVSALREVIGSAKPYIEYLVDKIPQNMPALDLMDKLKPIFEMICNIDAVMLEHYTKVINARFNLGLQPLKDQIGKHRKEKKLKTALKRIEDSGYPSITINKRQLRDIVKDAENILLDTANNCMKAAATGNIRTNDIPVFFRRSSALVYLEKDIDQGLILKGMSEKTMHAVITRMADWYVRSQEEVEHVKPPKDVASHLCSLVPHSLCDLQALITTPIYGSDGRLIVEPGYHTKDRLWFQPPAGFTLPIVPENPTREQIEAAKRLIFDHVFVDFPLVTHADRAAALSALLMVFMRKLFPGPTPMHLFEAPSPGTGKTKLCDVISLIVTGQAAIARSLPQNEDERRKMLTSELFQAGQIILLDNEKNGKRLDSPVLAAYLTSLFINDRLLGTNQMLNLLNHALWMMTINNPVLSMELARRSIRIRLDTKMDRAWMRGEKDFKHFPLEAWVLAHRTELLAAVLTMIQAWIVESCPGGNKTLGSFEGWATAISGLFEVIGVTGFLENLDQLYEDADAEGETWRELVATWWTEYHDNPKKAGELAALCREHDLMGAKLGDKKEHVQATIMGKMLNDARDRVYDSYRITVIKANGKTKSKSYSLTKVKKTKEARTPEIQTIEATLPQKNEQTESAAPEPEILATATDVPPSEQMETAEVSPAPSDDKQDATTIEILSIAQYDPKTGTTEVITPDVQHVASGEEGIDPWGEDEAVDLADFDEY